MSDLLGLVMLGVIFGLGLLAYAAYETMRRLWCLMLGRVQAASAELPARDAALYGALVTIVSLAILWLIDGMELVIFALCCSAVLLFIGFCFDRMATLANGLRRRWFGTPTGESQG